MLNSVSCVWMWNCSHVKGTEPHELKASICSGKGLVPSVVRQQAITLTKVDPDQYPHMLSPGQNRMIRYSGRRCQSRPITRFLCFAFICQWSTSFLNIIYIYVYIYIYICIYIYTKLTLCCWLVLVVYFTSMLQGQSTQQRIHRWSLGMHK